MKNSELPKRDPEAAYVRDAVAQRRVGVNAKCACGETRPHALVPNRKPTICYHCERKQRGRTTADNHHFASEANSSVTIPVWVNDHRAELSVMQYDWPKQTRENPNGSPLISAAACIRGFIDTILYLIEMGLRWIADMLETADAYLASKLGPQWWDKTELEKFAPEAKKLRKP
jgi:hypothetical protein